MIRLNSVLLLFGCDLCHLCFTGFWQLDYLLHTQKKTTKIAKKLYAAHGSVMVEATNSAVFLIITWLITTDLLFD